MATGAAWCAWFVSCVVAVGLLAGALVVVHERGDAVLTRRARGMATLVIVAAVLSSAMLVEGHRQLTMYPARRHLPPDAVVLREEIVEDGFLPDYSCAISATMSQQQFEGWVRALGLVPCAPLGEWCRPGQPVDGEWGAHASYDGRVGRFRSWDS